MCNKITLLDEIQNAKSIMIVSDANNLASASALYTYVLMQHKKVTLVCQEENLDKRLSFLPWFNKIKSKKNLNADLVIELSFSSQELYGLFKNASLKINKKIATALYAGILQESNGFVDPDENGMVFAFAKELINSGAEYKLCTKNLLQTKSLALLRLKSLMFRSMILKNNAQEAIFSISDDDLKSSGASLKDCDEVLKEALHLASLKRAVLVDCKNKIIKVKER